MNLTPAQSEYLVTLPPGEAAVHADGMDYPLLARMPDGTSCEATEQAPAAGPEPVISPRSPTCAPDCATRPCTLGQMRAAQRAAITDPRITLWAELTVVAHLTGCETPRPAPAFTASLCAMATRQRDCAISHAVDAAIAARVPAICSRLSPAGLAAHVVATMRQVITEGATACQAEEPRYLALPYRWALVRDALRPAYHSPATGRNPRSAEWERVYSQPVPGDSGKAQFITVTRWYLRDQRDSQATTIVWGSRSRPAVEQAIGTHASSDDWADQFAVALDAFAPLPWPGHLMSREPVRIPRVPEEPGTADE